MIRLRNYFTILLEAGKRIIFQMSVMSVKLG